MDNIDMLTGIMNANLVGVRVLNLWCRFVWDGL